MFIGYIPSDMVDSLSAAVKAKQSTIYTATQGIAQQLADHIDATYSVTSITNPITSSGGGSSSQDSNTGSSSTSSSSSNNTRIDAIIGVCSALGGIALCILGFLVWRNYKQKQELAHRRLSDPMVDGAPAPGQQFDRDSLGGQRRRSFYYAEDSLRGFAQAPVNEDAYEQQISGAGGMRERRTIVPGTISHPILRDNTLNW